MDTEFIPKTHSGNAEVASTPKSPSYEEGKVGMRREELVKRERCAFPSQAAHFQTLSCPTPLTEL